MIQVMVRRKGRELDFRMDGHADFSPGKADIVCAAASMLAYTLMRRLRALLPEKAFLEERTESGQLRLLVELGNAPQAVEALETIMEGFFLLSEEYPGCVKVI